MSVAAPTQPTPARLDGLKTYFSVLFSPAAAFERLSRVPTWGWAAIIGIALTLVAMVLIAPAQLHMTAVMQNERVSQMPADQQAQARAVMASATAVTKVAIYIVTFIIPWFAWIVSAVVFLIAAALGGGEVKFAKAWVAAVNGYVIYGIASIVNATIVRMRDPNSVNSPTDIMSLPSLGLFVHGNPKLAAFFFTYNVLYIWSYVIAVIALERMMKVSRTAAIVTVVIYSLLWALIGMLSAR